MLVAKGRKVGIIILKCFWAGHKNPPRSHLGVGLFWPDPEDEFERKYDEEKVRPKAILAKKGGKKIDVYWKKFLPFSPPCKAVATFLGMAHKPDRPCP